MLRWKKLKIIFILLVAASSTGCALGLIATALGDKKATHADDQSVETGGNKGYINN